jgi:CDP-6-deoxy-D-xylo-4-hexulose-3-dehydrase
MIKLVTDTITKEDVKELSSWLLQDQTPQLTKGALTKKLEQKWASAIETKYSVYVNSGSSAILLTLSALKQGGYLKNDKVIVPSLSWHTDVSSPMVLGMTPILCDCNMHDLSCDLEHLEKLFIAHNPSALILVSVLGLVPDMEKVLELCNKYDVILLEDVCESAGSKYKNNLLGTFGKASFFSFYYGHHLSSIEGGFINTDDENLANILLSIRNHGWDRDLSLEAKSKLRSEWNVNEFDALYKFYYEGFNFRSTDLQAFIALRQVDRLEEYSLKRNVNFKLYNSLIKNNILSLNEGNNFVSNFAFPVLNKNRDLIVKELIQNNIEVRPLIAGSMGNQPFWIKKYGKTILPNCDIIDTNGFYIPNNHNILQSEIELICNIINKF